MLTASRDAPQSRNEEAHTEWLRVLFRQDWVVYSKPPFGGPEHVLRYLGADTHRVAISNHRVVALTDGNVTLRWFTDEMREVIRTLAR